MLQIIVIISLLVTFNFSFLMEYWSKALSKRIKEICYKPTPATELLQEGQCPSSIIFLIIE